jgi:hypothetical protein
MAKFRDKIIFMQNISNSKKLFVGLVIISTLVLFIIWRSRTTSDQNIQESFSTEAREDGDQVAQTTASDDIPTTNNRIYKDGTYSSAGSYVSPAGPEEVFISLTIVDDKVTAANFDGRATHPASVKLQNMFKDGFEKEVVGKSIDSLNLTAVNGSSLTPKGFNDAVTKIRIEAQS